MTPFHALVLMLAVLAGLAAWAAIEMLAHRDRRADAEYTPRDEPDAALPPEREVRRAR